MRAEPAHRSEPVARAIKAAGSVQAIADAIGKTPQAVSLWRRVPAEHAIAVGKLTNIPLHELRSDLWQAAEAT